MHEHFVRSRKYGFARIYDYRNYGLVRFRKFSQRFAIHSFASFSRVLQGFTIQVSHAFASANTAKDTIFRNGLVFNVLQCHCSSKRMRVLKGWTLLANPVSLPTLLSQTRQTPLLACLSDLSHLSFFEFSNANFLCFGGVTLFCVLRTFLAILINFESQNHIRKIANQSFFWISRMDISSHIIMSFHGWSDASQSMHQWIY